MRVTSAIGYSQLDLDLRFLKKGIWLYFYLLIFEGALRKWVLPGFADQLLIIRDPIALGILFFAIKKQLWKPNSYVILIMGISILALAGTFLIGHGNIKVAFYGIRILIIQFPLIFVIGNVFQKKDVLKLGKVMLWLSIGMTLLLAVQFFSPQSAWVNRGIGGMEGSGFSGGAGYFRVPGTFSFTNGLSLFYGLAAAYIFFFWISEERKHISQILLLISSLSLLAAIPLSISRTVLFEIALSVVFMMTISARSPGIIKNIMIVGVVGALLFFAISDFTFFETATKAFTERFTTANRNEGGMIEGVFIDRFLGGMVGAIGSENFNFWGSGLGMGTSVGAKFLIGDRGVYLIAEEEWGRLVGEMGLILGMSTILIRLALVIELLKKSWTAISGNNILPWMLMSFGMFNLLQGQWAQPTNLGFGILIGGLVLASFKKKNSPNVL